MIEHLKIILAVLLRLSLMGYSTTKSRLVLRRILHGFPSACFRHSIAYAVGIPMGCHSNLVGWPFPRIVSGPGCPSRSVPKVIRQRAVSPNRAPSSNGVLRVGRGNYRLFPGNHRLLPEPEWMSPVLTPSNYPRFMADWFAHSASYASGFLGGAVLCMLQYLKTGPSYTLVNAPNCGATDFWP
jgi:hypothetical protein